MKDIFLFYIQKILNQKFNLNFYSNEINKNKNLKQADFISICYLIKNILQEEFLGHYLNVVLKIISESLIIYLYKIKKK